MPHARAVSPCSPLSYTVPLSRPVPRLVPSYRVGGAFLFRNFLSHRLSSRLVPRVVGRGVMSSRLVPRLVLLSDGRGVFRLPGPISSCPCGGGCFLSLRLPVVVSSAVSSHSCRRASRLVPPRVVSSDEGKQAGGGCRPRGIGGVITRASKQAAWRDVVPGASVAGGGVLLVFVLIVPSSVLVLVITRASKQAAGNGTASWRGGYCPPQVVSLFSRTEAMIPGACLVILTAASLRPCLIKHPSLTSKRKPG